MLDKLLAGTLALIVAMVSVAATTTEPMSAERTDLFTVRVERATFATIRPDPIRVSIGTEMQSPMNAFAPEDGVIEWEVAPGIEYEVTVTDQTGDEPVRELIEVGMTREHLIQHNLFKMYELREELTDELGVNYFEMIGALRLLREKGYIE